MQKGARAKRTSRPTPKACGTDALQGSGVLGIGPRGGRARGMKLGSKMVAEDGSSGPVRPLKNLSSGTVIWAKHNAFPWWPAILFRKFFSSTVAPLQIPRFSRAGYLQKGAHTILTMLTTLEIVTTVQVGGVHGSGLGCRCRYLRRRSSSRGVLPTPSSLRLVCAKTPRCRCLRRDTALCTFWDPTFPMLSSAMMSM